MYNNNDTKTFLLEDLFEITSSNGNLTKSQLNEDPYGIPYVTRSEKNNGITNYVDVDKKYINKGNVLTFALDTNVCFYQKKDFCTGNNVKIMHPKFTLTENVALFLSSVINKTFANLNWGDYSGGKDALDKVAIDLPIVACGEPDWSLMEQVIQESKKQYINQQEKRNEEKYNKLVNLLYDKSSVLTKQDKIILNKDKELVEFPIEKLFEFKTPKRKFNANSLKDIQDKQNSEYYPYIVRTKFNNGIKGYIKQDEKYLCPENTISFGQDTATVFYQKQPYFTADKIKIMLPINFNLNENTALFFLGTLRKTFANAEWGNTSYNVDDLKKETIVLPIKDNVLPETATIEDIDFDYMDQYIESIKKLYTNTRYQKRIGTIQQMKAMI